MTTKMIPLVLVVALVLGSSCAKPDWIEQTLVTADVTGTWRTAPEGAFGILSLQRVSSSTRPTSQP